MEIIYNIYSIVNKKIPDSEQMVKDFLSQGKLITLDTPQTRHIKRVFAKKLAEMLRDPTSELYSFIGDHVQLYEALVSIYETMEQYAQMRRPVITDENIYELPEIGGQGKRLGAGTYGIVYDTLLKNYVVKELVLIRFRVGRITLRPLSSMDVKEFSIMRYLDGHPNIIGLHAIQLNPIRIAMERADEDLYRVMTAAINNQPGLKDTFNLNNIRTRKWVIYQLLRGIAYCHSKFIWHIDLKPENILVKRRPDDTLLIKITDFGMASPFCRSGTNYCGRDGTPHYTAPETLVPTGMKPKTKIFDETIDEWAIGMILLNCIYRVHSILYSSKYTGHAQLLINIFKILGLSYMYTPFEVIAIASIAFRDSGIEPTYNQITELISDIQSQPLDKPFESLNIDVDEKEVVTALVAYVENRKRAIDVMKMAYFDEVRDQIERDIPVSAILPTDCIQSLVAEQRPSPNTTIKEPFRMLFLINFFNVIIEKATSQLSYFELLYSVALFDRTFEQLSENIKITISNNLWACYIISKMWHSPIFNLVQYPQSESRVRSRSRTRARTGDDEEVISSNFEKILRIFKKSDFDLIFPTCYQFIIEYINTSINRFHTQERVLIIFMSILSYMLYINYDMATRYTPQDIVEIAAQAINIVTHCRKNIPLYDQTHYEYLISLEKKSPYFKNIIKLVKMGKELIPSLNYETI